MNKQSSHQKSNSNPFQNHEIITTFKTQHAVERIPDEWMIFLTFTTIHPSNDPDPFLVCLSFLTYMMD